MYKKFVKRFLDFALSFILSVNSTNLLRRILSKNSRQGSFSKPKTEESNTKEQYSKESLPIDFTLWTSNGWIKTTLPVLNLYDLPPISKLTYPFFK